MYATLVEQLGKLLSEPSLEEKVREGMVHVFTTQNIPIAEEFVEGIENLMGHTLLDNLSWDIVDVCSHRCQQISLITSKNEEEEGEDSDSGSVENEIGCENNEARVVNGDLLEVSFVLRLINVCTTLKGKDVYLCLMGGLAQGLELLPSVCIKTMKVAFSILLHQTPSFWLKESPLFMQRMLSSLHRMLESNPSASIFLVEALVLVLQLAKLLISFMKEPFEEEEEEEGEEEEREGEEQNAEDGANNTKRNTHAPAKHSALSSSVRLELEMHCNTQLVDTIVEIHRMLLDISIPPHLRQETLNVLEQLNVNLFSLLSILDVQSQHEKLIDVLELQGIKWPVTAFQYSSAANAVILELSMLARKGPVYATNNLGMASLAHSLVAADSNSFLYSLSAMFVLKQLHEHATILINCPPDSLGCSKGIDLLELVVTRLCKHQTPVSLLEQTLFRHKNEHRLLDGLQQSIVFANTQEESTKRLKLFRQYIDIYDSEGRYSLYSVLFRSIGFDTIFHAVIPLLQRDVKKSLEKDCPVLHKTLFSGAHLWGLLDFLTKENVPTLDNLINNIHRVSLTINFFIFLFSLGASDLPQRIGTNILNVWELDCVHNLKSLYLSPLEITLREASCALSEKLKDQTLSVEREQDMRLLSYYNIASFRMESLIQIVNDALHMMTSKMEEE